MTPDARRSLADRVSQGFDTLLEMERSGNTNGRYPVWFRDWEKLLRQYEAELTAVQATA